MPIYKVEMYVTNYRELNIGAMSQEEAKDFAIDRIRRKHPEIVECDIENIEEVVNA